MARNRVLVIDDEQLNLFIIEEFLSEEQLDLDLQSNPVKAWEKLLAAEGAYSLVVLDRMMPGLDGLSFLRRMKEHPGLADIPVIMQTAAAAPEQVREGLQAGAYYYLIKPYEPEALVSIVRGALEDHRVRNTLRHLSRRLEDAHKLLQVAEYRFSSLQEVNQLLPVLASFAPNPDVTAAGLADLMVNAVEHGNLGISYKEKAQLKMAGAWEKEIESRRLLSQYRDRFATVRVERLPDHVQFTVTDQGEGFDWAQYLEFAPERAFDPNGRGIAMARKLSFSSLEYLGKGNVVVATVPGKQKQ